MNDTQAESAVRVLIVDDHSIVRRGIAGMLSDISQVTVIGETTDGQQGVLAVRELQPDLVLMDLRMPRMDGASAIAELRRQGNMTPILVLTTYDTDADILRAIEAGANGYLLKDCSQEELISAITATAGGESWLAPAVANRLMRQMQRPAIEQPSAREISVLQRVAKGFSNKEIAAEMHISQATVKSHLIHIFRKLDVNDRTAAVTVALERGIISM